MNIQFSFSLLLCSQLFLIAACDDPSNSAGDSSISASEVSFDNEQTDLNSTNAQDALIEIGTKPDIVDRINVVENTEEFPPGSTILAGATCEQGDIAIGGGCFTSKVTASLHTAGVEGRGMICRYYIPLNETTTEVTVRVTCLSPNP